MLAPIRNLSGLLIVVGLLGVSPAASATPSPIPDETWVTDGRVYASVRLGNRIYIGGSFRQVGPNTGFGVVIGSDGRRNPAFPKVNGEILAAIPDGQGGWFIGGRFTFVGGKHRPRLARVLSTGAVSSWYPRPNGPVHALAASGGVVYVGGQFTSLGETTRNRLAAVDATTGSVLGWNPAANGSVYALAAAPGVVYAGGAFTTLGGQPRNRLAAVDAATGGVLGWNPGANGDVLALSVSGGTLYAGGAFTAFGGQPRNRLAAVAGTTGALRSWNPNASGTVRVIVASSGAVYAGGEFTVLGGQSRDRLAAVDAATGGVLGWNPGANGDVLALSVSGGTLYAGGAFTSLGGQPRNRLAAVDANSGTLGAWDPNANGTVRATALSGGAMFAGGSFTSVGGWMRNRLAAIDATTGQADPVWNPNADAEVYDLALAPDGTRVFAAGAFKNIAGLARGRLAALDPVTGAAIPSWSAGASYKVRDLAVGNGVLYAGGEFTYVRGLPRDRLVALNLVTGDVVPGWTPAANARVRTVELSPDGGRLYIGGDFSSVSGQDRRYIAVVSAQSGDLLAWRPDIAFPVYDVAASTTVAYAGGSGPGGRLVALDAQTAGPIWVVRADGDVQAVALDADGLRVYFGGHFSTFATGELRRRLAMVDATTGVVDPWSPVANSNEGVWGLTVDGSYLYSGGDFTVISGAVQQGFARFREAS